MVYNEKTIVGGKEIVLSGSDKQAVETFHLSRVAFAFVDDKCLTNVHDVREHKVYLQEDHGVTDEEFETLTRGYIKPGRIVFYTTLNFNRVEEITDDQLDKVCELAGSTFGTGDYEVWNGVKIQKEFGDWPPIEIVQTVHLA
jgi:hypothetical protein